jgi:hypothetical protein
MASKLINFDKRLAQSVRFFCRGRQEAAKKQLAAGKADQGNRGAVTGGKNLDAFRDMIVDVVRRYGPDGCEVHRAKSMIVLPGFFRPTKQWDLLIVFQKQLLAAFELKSLCERMVEQQLYSCASVLVAPNSQGSGQSSHLSNQTAFRSLLSRLAGHLASEADLLGERSSRIKDQPTGYESNSLLAGDWFSTIEDAEENG